MSIAMSADSRNLSVLAYAQGFTLWHYRCAGALASVYAPEYFAAFQDMIAVGDVLQVSADDGFAQLYAMPAGRPPKPGRVARPGWVTRFVTVARYSEPAEAIPTAGGPVEPCWMFGPG